MTPELKNQFPNSLNSIFISKNEICDINWFINQYIENRNLRSNYQAEGEIISALHDYPGVAPVRLFELNAWLDQRFRQKDFCRPTARTLKLIISNDHIPPRQ